MGRTPKLSIIIPAFKRSDLLYYGLRAIREQVIEYDYEIIVLNDGIDTDGTQDVCKKFSADYVFTGYRNANGLKWRCPGAAINIGVKRCLGSIILLTVPEIYLTSRDVIQKLTSEVEINPRALAIPKGYDDINGLFLKHIKNNGNFASFDSPKHLANLHTDYPFCMALSKQEFISIGGYDNAFSTGDGLGYDDSDFCLRLINNKCVYHRLNDISVVHLYHPREREGFVNVLDAFEYNKNLYLTKNKTPDNIIRNVGIEWGILGS